MKGIVPREFLSQFFTKLSRLGPYYFLEIKSDFGGAKDSMDKKKLRASLDFNIT